MGEKVQIARQDTLLEVQTTGTQTKNTLDVVNGKIGNLGDTAEEGTLFGQMAGGSGSTGVVKSVQMGIITSNFLGEKTIPINTVDPSKCIVIISHMSMYLDRYTSGCVFKSLNSNSLLLIGSDLVQQASWQVIEFY